MKKHIFLNISTFSYCKDEETLSATLARDVTDGKLWNNPSESINYFWDVSNDCYRSVIDRIC